MTNSTKAALEVMMALAETIRAAKEIPSGHLYARVMGIMDLDNYNGAIGVLKRTKLVEEDRNHMLRWIGPEIAGR